MAGQVQDAQACRGGWHTLIRAGKDKRIVCFEAYLVLLQVTQEAAI